MRYRPHSFGLLFVALACGNSPDPAAENTGGETTLATGGVGGSSSTVPGGAMAGTVADASTGAVSGAGTTGGGGVAPVGGTGGGVGSGGATQAGGSGAGATSGASGTGGTQVAGGSGGMTQPGGSGGGGNSQTGGSGAGDTQATGGVTDPTGGSSGTTVQPPTGGGGGEASSCVPGLDSGDPCDPAVDTVTCERSDRSCECGSSGEWACTPNDGGTGGEGGSNSGGGGTEPTGGTGAGGDAGSGGDGPSGGDGGGDPGSGGTGGTDPNVCPEPSANPGSVITFNDDGGWCWYQDERAIVDAEANKLIIGSVAIGGNRNGNIEATIYDLAGGGSPQRSKLGDLNPDDHNTAALSKVGEGKYVAVYTTHNDDCYSYYNIYEGGSWGAQQRFDWGPHGCPVQTPSGTRTISYSNLWHMGDEIYNFVRSVETSPNLIVSPDGDGWTYAGRLSSTDAVGYVAGYYKYWGNNRDRIDFVGTEAHPRDFDNNLYHGYVQDGKTYKSDGTEADNNLLDGNAPDVKQFTKLFATGSRLGSATLTHLWNCDLMRYEDGTIALIFTGRANGDTNDPDKRFGYARFDGTSWKSTYLVNAGHKLYDSEQDYTGLGALHPNNPHVIYISTAYDPRTDTALSGGKHEIWRGITCDDGQTFDWTPITENSSQDQLRPIVPYWDSDKTVLLWMKGTYASAQTYTTSIVGLVMDGV